jgi:hypothetical protein
VLAAVERLRPLASDVAPLHDGASSLLERLPSAHCELLSAMNGFMVQHGVLRVFGVGRGDALDVEGWNEPDTWRFAWDDRVDDFFCFATTAWGDQYAYRRRDVGGPEPAVYFLEATMLRPEILAATFEDFLEREVLRVAEGGPYDSLTRAALGRFGGLSSDELWAFAPSIALGGDESLDNVVHLASSVAMTIAGDIASALRASTPGSWPTGVDPWVDGAGRQRLRVRFDRE